MLLIVKKMNEYEIFALYLQPITETFTNVNDKVTQS